MPLPTDAARLVVTQTDGRTTARITGCSELTDTNIDAVGRQLDGLIDGRAGMHLVVDLAGIEFLGSAALVRFVRLNRALQAADGRLTIQNVTPRLREVFLVSRLDTVLDVRVAD
jgi:anti-anti-sigma factor